MDQRDRETLKLWLAGKNEEEKSLIRVFAASYSKIIRQIQRNGCVLGGETIEARKVNEKMDKSINNALSDLFCELFDLKNITLNPESFTVLEELLSNET